MMEHNAENHEAQGRISTEDLLERTAPDSRTDPDTGTDLDTGTGPDSTVQGDLANPARRTELASTEPASTDPRRTEPASHEPGSHEAGSHEAGRVEHDEHAELIEDADSARFRDRWHEVQAAFVDDPQRAVSDADQLVAELMQTLEATFAERKQALEGQWQKGNEAETEDLRLALRSYRSFFDQLLPH